MNINDGQKYGKVYGDDKSKINRSIGRELKKTGFKENKRKAVVISQRMSEVLDSMEELGFRKELENIIGAKISKPKKDPLSKGLNKLRKQLAHSVTINVVKTVFKGGAETYRSYNLMKENSQLLEDFEKTTGQTIVGVKTIGVEPGFTARKIWKDKDTQKLHTPGTKHYRIAREFLEDLPLSIVKEIKDEEDLGNFLDIIQNLDSEDESEVNTLDLIKKNYPDIYEKIKKHIVEHVQSKHRKFQKLHYWKLDYSEPVKGKVRIDLAQAHGNIHWKGTTETPREKNFGAIMEALANDIFEVLGFGGQKLSLHLGQYEDESPKFLLDGTHVEGPNGEKFTTFKDILKGDESQGRIEGNMVFNPDNPKGPKVPLDEKMLGVAFLISLLMGDRDKVGGGGGNLGYVVIDFIAMLMNIDPGKSMEEPSWWSSDRLVQNDLRSDCTFDHISTLADKFVTSGYKNFSIFSDVPLSYKIQGMRQIQENFHKVEKIFDHYIKFFEENEDLLDPEKLRGNELTFSERIKSAKGRLSIRKNYFESVLKERLDLSDDKIDLLDHVEKLTSPTTDHAIVYDENGEKKKIQLKHLAVVNPKKNRKEWHLEKSGDGHYTLYYAFRKGKEENTVLEKLRDFKDNFHDGKTLIDFSSEDGKVMIKFSEDQFEDVFNLFSEENIAEFGGKKLWKPE